MSKISSAKKRAKNGFRIGLDNPLRTKRSRYAGRFQYEVRFAWWADISGFREQAANSGGNVKFVGGRSINYSHNNGNRIVAYMNEGDYFILRMAGLDDSIFRAYRLIPESTV